MAKKKTVAKKKSTAGRPTRYKTEYAEQARKLCLFGYTDQELADFFEVSKSTINKWKHDHKQFSDSIKSGKENADIQVVDSLYRKANGYRYQEEANSKEGPVMLEKYAHPDTTAAIFWLKNRQPRKWRDKQDIEISGELSTTSTFKIVDENGNEITSQDD